MQPTLTPIATGPSKYYYELDPTPSVSTKRSMSPGEPDIDDDAELTTRNEDVEQALATFERYSVLSSNHLNELRVIVSEAPVKVGTVSNSPSMSLSNLQSAGRPHRVNHRC